MYQAVNPVKMSSTLIPASAKPATDCYQRANRNYYYKNQSQILANQKIHHAKNKAVILAKRRFRYKMKKLKKEVLQEMVDESVRKASQRKPKHYKLAELKTVLPYTSNHYENLKLALKHLEPSGELLVDNWTADDNAFQHDHETYSYEGCCCGHKIRYEYHIKHIITGDTLEVGSRCIGKLFDKDLINAASLSFKKYKNPNAKYCPDCNKKVLQKIVDKFPNKKHVFHNICFARTRLRSCEWCDKLINQSKMKEHCLTVHQKNLDKINAENHILTFGKFKGNSLGFVQSKHKGYFKWLASDKFDGHVNDLAKLLID